MMRWRGIRRGGCASSDHTPPPITAIAKECTDHDRNFKEEAGAEFDRLIGCVKCEYCVWVAGTTPHCPQCQSPTTQDLAIYFPPARRLQKLLQLSEWRHLISYERRRSCPPDMMTDVYDTEVRMWSWTTYIN